MLEQEAFWDSESFVIVTDRTKPAMKWTIERLISMGKRVYVIDLSDRSDKETIQSISELPSDVDCAVVGLTKMNPADVIEDLAKKGIRKYWMHWRTETPEAKKLCDNLQTLCITGRCPMMYLSRGFSVHELHRGAAKLFGKY